MRTTTVRLRMMLKSVGTSEARLRVLLHLAESVTTTTCKISCSLLHQSLHQHLLKASFHRCQTENVSRCTKIKNLFFSIQALADPRGKFFQNYRMEPQPLWLVPPLLGNPGSANHCGGFGFSVHNWDLEYFTHPLVVIEIFGAGK